MIQQRLASAFTQILLLVLYGSGMKDRDSFLALFDKWWRFKDVMVA